MGRKKPDWESAQKKDRIRDNGQVSVSTILHTPTAISPDLAWLDRCAHRMVAPAAGGNPMLRKAGAFSEAMPRSTDLDLVDCDRCHNAFLARALAGHSKICPKRRQPAGTRSIAKNFRR